MILLAIFLIPLSVGTAPAATAVLPAQPAAPVEPEVKPAEIVVLVDLSGSISDQDLIREKDAAGLIAQSEFSPRSTVAVIGFGSDEGGVSATDVACPPVVVSGAAERQRLSDCVGALRKREPGRGDDTDHAAALEQALGYFTGPAEGPRTIFLLTDGKLDVGDTARYGTGKTLEQRNAAAQEQLTGLLRRAADSGVQIWPLGFGDVDVAALDGFASGGFQGVCGEAARQPVATVVAASTDVPRLIVKAYGDARCAGTNEPESIVVEPGSTVDVAVTIPSIATNGAISVIKRDPRIGIEYRDPDGVAVPKVGSIDGSIFEVSGENGPVEALRIVDPQPGTWTVRIAAPAEVPALDVTTAVTWQGAVQALLIPSPSSVSAGQPVVVSLSLRTRRGPVTDADQLAGLAFAAELVGSDGMPQVIAMADDGREPDPTAADGTYTGQVTVPTDVEGSVEVVGRVRGVGISGDEPRATVGVMTGPPALLVSATLPNINDTVAPGGTAEGTVTVTNNSGGERRLLLLVEQGSSSAISVPEDAATHVVAASGNTEFPAMLAFAPGSPQGPASGLLNVVDATDPGSSLGRFPFTVQVAEPPCWWCYIGGGAAVLGVLVLAVWAVLHRHGQDLSSARIEVAAAGRTSRPATAPNRARVVRFTVTVEQDGPPQVQQVTTADAYRLTRSGEDLRLKPPAGREMQLRFDTPKEIADGITLLVRRPFGADARPAPEDGRVSVRPSPHRGEFTDDPDL